MVVGTLIWRTSRRIHVRRDALDRPDPVDGIDAADIIGEAKLHGLGAVGDRAAAHGDDEIGIGGAGLLGGGDDGLARRVRRHRIEGPGVSRPQAFADFLDLGGRAVERAADHQEGAAHAQTVDLSGDRVRGRAAENNLVHGAENDTPLVHDDCPPGTAWFCCSFANNLAEVPHRWEP